MNFCSLVNAADTANLSVSTKDLIIENGKSNEFFLKSNIELEDPAIVCLFSTNDGIAMAEDHVSVIFVFNSF